MTAVEIPIDSWRLTAACRDLDPDMFYPPPGDQLAIAAARAVCLTCKVRVNCLNFARQRGERYGVWGGVYMEQQRFSRKVTCSRCDSTDLMRWNGRIECTNCGFTWEG